MTLLLAQPSTLERWLTLVVLASAALAAMLYLGRQSRSLFRVLAHITHELSPNGGSSMKDDITAVALAVGQLQADYADLVKTKQSEHLLLQAQLDEHTRQIARHRGKAAP